MVLTLNQILVLSLQVWYAKRIVEKDFFLLRNLKKKQTNKSVKSCFVVTLFYDSWKSELLQCGCVLVAYLKTDFWHGICDTIPITFWIIEYVIDNMSFEAWLHSRKKKIKSGQNWPLLILDKNVIKISCKYI